MDALNALLMKLKERATAPGVMSLAGQALEKKMAKALKRYFGALGRACEHRLKKISLVNGKEVARHQAEIDVRHLTRVYSHTLLHILARSVQEAILKADRQLEIKHLREAAKTRDTTGMSAKEAAQYAAESAAKNVAGINETTVSLYANAVATAIDDQLGVDGLSRLLREITDGMTKSRADMIATTEIGDAFGEAALRKLTREEIEYKQLIPSPDACDICLSIVEAGPVPVDEPFVDDDGEEYDRSPIHPRCRCATVGARGPEADNG